MSTRISLASPAQMRYNRHQRRANPASALLEAKKITMQISRRRLFAAFSVSVAVCFFLDGAYAATQSPQTLEGAAGQTAPAPANGHTQWRKLHRRMSKDEVKGLLGDPQTVSVSRFAEVWYYLRGSATFDGKGRLDMWTEY